jgi:IS30 family transposase
MTQDEVDELVLAVRDGLSKGQSIHHLFATHDMPCSERSFYRYVERQDIPIKSIDLAKKVKYKKRHKAKIDIHASGFYNGHEYEDFLLLEDDERASVTEVDTVWGTRSDRKCILSLHRVDLHFQLYMLLERRDTAHVVAALDLLEKCCDGKFREFFGLLLLDRGVEFDDISGIESSMAGGVRCAAYFADPNRPDQKGACEKNHVELRKILPKGTSLANMDMATLALICSHVNSSVRKGLGDTTPMQMAMAVLPKCIFDALGLFLIPPTDVIGAPNILYRP